MVQDQATFSLMKSIVKKVIKSINRRLKVFGLTVAQMHVLSFLLKDTQRVVSQKDIETYLGVAHPTVIGILRGMEKNDLITFGFDSEDKRLKNVYPTEKAEALNLRVEMTRQEINNLLFQDLTEEEQAELHRLLKKISARLL